MTIEAVGELDIKWKSKKELMKRYDISPTTLWRWARERGYPKPVKCGGKNLWILEEVRAWEERQIESR